MTDIIKPCVKKIVKLAENGLLSEGKVRDLKKEYNPKQIELISACLKNDKGSVEKIINEGEIDLSVCNDYVIRYTVTKGWIEISKLLLKHNVEP